MRVINVDGKLQTTSSWGAEAEAARQQQRVLAQLKADIRLILEGRPQEEPKTTELALASTPEVYEQAANRLSREPVQASALTAVDYSSVEQRVCAQMAATAAKPPALWLGLDQISKAERSGLWHHTGTLKATIVSFADTIPESDWAHKRYWLKAAPSVCYSASYQPWLYQHPDSDGWFIHDPQPDSVRPIPAYIKILVKFRNGSVGQASKLHSVWRIGVEGDRRPHCMDIVAWKLL